MPPNDVGLDPRYTMPSPDPVREPGAWAAAFEPRVASFSMAVGRRPKMVALVRRVVADFYGALYDEIAAPVLELQIEIAHYGHATATSTSRSRGQTQTICQ